MRCRANEPYEDGDATKVVLEYVVVDANGTRMESLTTVIRTWPLPIRCALFAMSCSPARGGSRSRRRPRAKGTGRPGHAGAVPFVPLDTADAGEAVGLSGVCRVGSSYGAVSPHLPSFAFRSSMISILNTCMYRAASRP
ncbi:hypothetical protein ACWDYJ_13035, partial [Streptomyces sp. NPDC003042]